MTNIALRADVCLGVVPTHLKFVGGLLPDEVGKLPRTARGQLLVVERMQQICQRSPAKLSCVQIPFFSGLDADDVEELVGGLGQLGLDVQFILMVGGADPMNPADEDRVVQILVEGLMAAKRHGIGQLASTSIEQWMQPGAVRREGRELIAAMQQNATVHVRAYREAGVDDSIIQAWDIEFLRRGEFQTFTDVRRAGEVVQAMNVRLGKPFFRVLVDAAHCGDSGLTQEENAMAIQEIAARGELGIFHASAKTTRGCLSTDDGWVAAMLRAVAETGCLRQLFVEVFHHEDAGLQPLRDLDSGHGKDTTDGRDYEQVVLDGLADVARRVNNLVARQILISRS